MPKAKQKTRASSSYSLRILCEHRDLDDEEQTPNTKSTCQNWRDSLRISNPEKHREVMESGKADSAYYRMMCGVAEEKLKSWNLDASECEKWEMWFERKKRSNETARKRMKKMNDKLKLEESTKPPKPKKVETRQKADQQIS